MYNCVTGHQERWHTVRSCFEPLSVVFCFFTTKRPTFISENRVYYMFNEQSIMDYSENYVMSSIWQY